MSDEQNYPGKDGPCPCCGAEWKAEPIDEAYRSWYGGSTHYSRVIGIEYPYGHPLRYDGVSLWGCPDCGAVWDRWTLLLTEYGKSTRRGVKC